MALESSDVFVVQKQTGGKEVRKLSMAQLQSYLSAQPGVTYKGAANMTDAADTPSSPNTGDLWLNDAPNAGTWAWGAGYTGTVETTARAIWDGSAWDVMPGQSGDIGVEVVNGDRHDVRTQDIGVVVGLTAKGRAKHDISGFVRDFESLPIAA